MTVADTFEQKHTRADQIIHCMAYGTILHSTKNKLQHRLNFFSRIVRDRL